LEEYLLSPLSMSAPYQSSWVVGMAVKRGREELMIKLEDAMKELKETGELTRLFNKYNLTFSVP
jgi:ABC-type amino acid transport substrate-binding protein